MAAEVSEAERLVPNVFQCLDATSATAKSVYFPFYFNNNICDLGSHLPTVFATLLP